MKCIRFAVQAAVLILGAACAAAPDTAPAPVEGFGAQLDREIPALLEETLTPGAAVAVIRGGDVALIRTYGFADPKTQRPVDETTGFNIGSISKTVAAWGVMRLVEQKKLDLDAPVDPILTRWRLPESEFDRRGVTMRRLLSHTAGLSLHGYPGFGPDDAVPTVEESLSGKTNGAGDLRLIMEPGSEWKYSGGGYTLTQLIVEEITGRNFADYMRQNVLRPLGMTGSDYEISADVEAASSRCFDSIGEETPSPRFAAQAAAGLHTTIRDFAAFAAAALDGRAGAAGRGVLQPQSVALMTDPAPASKGRYGLGYSIEQLPDGRRMVGHGGSNRGWQAVFNVVPAGGDGIAVVTNSSNGWAVHSQIVCAWSRWLTGREPEDGCKKPMGLPILKALAADGAEAARAAYQQLREQTDVYSLSEGQMNRLGYDLLAKDRIDDAVALFQLNVEAFPDAWNPYDSLAEAYLKRGDIELAIQNYEKSVQLNPENKNGKDALDRIRAGERK